MSRTQPPRGSLPDREGTREGAARGRHLDWPVMERAAAGLPLGAEEREHLLECRDCQAEERRAAAFAPELLHPRHPVPDGLSAAILAAWAAEAPSPIVGLPYRRMALWLLWVDMLLLVLLAWRGDTGQRVMDGLLSALAITIHGDALVNALLTTVTAGGPALLLGAAVLFTLAVVGLRRSLGLNAVEP